MFGGWRLNHQQCRFQQQKRSFNDQNRWKMRRVVWISQLITSKIASAMDFLVNDGWCNHDIYIYIYARALLRKCVWFSYYLIYILYQWLQKPGCHSSQVICTEDADEHPYAHTASCHTELDGKCLGIIRRWQHLLTIINPSLPSIKHDYPICNCLFTNKMLKIVSDG